MGVCIKQIKGEILLGGSAIIREINVRAEGAGALLPCN